MMMTKHVVVCLPRHMEVIGDSFKNLELNFPKFVTPPLGT